MKIFKKIVLPIFLATIWISFSEFFRNELLFKSIWQNHYKSLGLTFPSEPINGAIWGIWSLLFAIVIYVIAQKFTIYQTTIVSWFAGFVLMWVTIGNLSVLPVKLLIFAIPLSILEVFVAALIISKLSNKKRNIILNYV